MPLTGDQMKLLSSLGLNSGNVDATLPLIEHIVDSIATLTALCKDQADSKEEAKLISSNTYGSYMSKLLTNSLGRAVTHMITNDFTATETEKLENGAAANSSSAAINGYHTISERILKNYPSFSQMRGSRGDKMLIHHAAYKHAAGEESLATRNIEMLLRAHPDGAKELDSVGATALHWATRNKNMTGAVLKAIIAANTSAVKTKDKSGYLPLHWVVCQDAPNFEIVKLLLEADPASASTRCNEGSLPIHWCVSRGAPSMDVVNLLIDAAPSSLQVKNNDGNLPLHCCVDRETVNISTVQLLIDSNAEALSVKNNEGHLPLHLVIDHDKPDVEATKLILSADPHAASVKDMHGHLPLHCILDNPHPDFLLTELILEAFPAAAETMTNEGLYPIHIATNICVDPSPHFISELLNKNPSAVRHEVIDSVPLDATANVHVWDGEWKEIRWTPFGRATERNLTKIVPILRAARFKAICSSGTDDEGSPTKGGIKKTTAGGRGGSLSPERPSSPSRAGATTHSPSLSNAMSRVSGSPEMAKDFSAPTGAPPVATQGAQEAALKFPSTSQVFNKYKKSSPSP